MSDDVDIASDREQVARDKAIKYIQNKPPAAVSTGYCLECGAPIANNKRWCDNYCRDDWQRWNPDA
jgi:RNA polymerase-binding transcription factor DksA